MRSGPGLLLSLLCAHLACVLSASLATAESRVALVIGNGAYVNTTPLTNPLNDARLMSQALKSTGFDVVEALDADGKPIKGIKDPAKIFQFVAAVRSADA